MSSRFDAVVLAGALFGIQSACAIKPSQVVGCYLATPALTYSAEGKLERGDSSWSHVQLSDNGKARRPLLRPTRDQRSDWRVDGNMLHVTFSDGLVGWQLQLTEAQDGWRGRATYVSDVRVVGGGWSPPQHQITLTRRFCQ
jgi:hypothetical protein